MRRRTSQDGYDAADGIALTGAFEPFEPKKERFTVGSPAAGTREAFSREADRGIEKLVRPDWRFLPPGDYRMNDPARKAELLAPT
jgi:hypothetical protein